MPVSSIVGIGDELLAGIVVNSNAAFIGQRMQAAGIPVVWSACIGDDEDQIVEVIREAIARSDAVIITGGLGPTQDDRTREALARLMGAKLIRDEAAVVHMRSIFERRGRTMPESNLRQADHPEGSTMVDNPLGTAPGIRADVDGTRIYAIPGVPRECMHLVDHTIVPELGELFGTATTIRTRTFHCVGIAESALGEMLHDLAVSEEPKLAFLPGEGSIRLRFVSTGVSAQQCEERLDACEAVVRDRVGASIWGMNDDTMESVAGDLLRERGWTLAVAESCTAGMLGARIASVPDASDYFRGGIVTYSSEVKAKSLGIAPSLIAAAGPVSGEVAQEMARGVRVALESDVGLSITCAAGPDPQGRAEVGTTFIALSGPGTFGVVRQLRLPGDREQVRQFATTFALSLLRQHASGEPLR